MSWRPRLNMVMYGAFIAPGHRQEILAYPGAKNYPKNTP